MPYITISAEEMQRISITCAEVESKTIRGEAVAQQAFKLQQSNKNPDIIIGHPGW